MDRFKGVLHRQDKLRVMSFAYDATECIRCAQPDALQLFQHSRAFVAWDYRQAAADNRFPGMAEVSLTRPRAIVAMHVLILRQHHGEDVQLFW